MAVPSPCPSCYSVNKPAATRCRVCGRRLTEPRTAARSARPVLLERVMTGEVFTAVIGGDARRAARAGADPEALEAERERLDEYRGALREYEAMLRTRAVTEGQTFGTYEPPKRRRRRKERSDAESTVALGPAMDAMRDRRFEDAVRILRESIEDDDANPRTWILLGEASLRLGRRFDAASAFHRSLDLSPADERGWLGLGRSLREVGELPAALASLDRAVAINPSSADAWSERGAILEALANLSEALRCYAKALELRPDSTTARARRSDLEGRLLADAKEHGRLPAPAGPASPEGTVEATPEAAAETASESESAAPPSADRAIDEILGLADVGVRSTPAKAPEPASAGEAGPVAGAGVRPAEPVPRPAKVRTYIDGLDDALDGGIPWGHVVLVQGTPGTMKSSVSFAILLKNAAEEGRHGLYVTLEERSESLLRQMASLGLPARVDRGSLVFLDPHSAKELLRERADWIPGLERAIEAIQAQRGLDLLVIDSLEALEVLAKFKDRRREIFRLFEWLRDLGVTSFVITERPDWVVGGHVVLGRWDEDFLADGLIQLRLHNVSDLDVQRRIRVMKMRGTKHEAGYFAFVLDDGRFRVTRAMSP